MECIQQCCNSANQWHVFSEKIECAHVRLNLLSSCWWMPVINVHQFIWVHSSATSINNKTKQCHLYTIEAALADIDDEFCCCEVLNDYPNMNEVVMTIL